jgi:hypothetical protein
MAKRPIFIPNLESQPLVNEILIEFEWHPGMSLQQKQRTINSLHKSAEKRGITPILEISTKSPSDLGKSLSAFNLQIETNAQQKICVEAAYQGGKIFENGGPYKDLYGFTGRQIKKDERLRNSGNLIAFEFNSGRWPLEPKTLFYDWLYVTALYQNSDLASQLLTFKGYSDIEFNPKKSVNCQARAAGLFVALQHRNLLLPTISNKEEFIRTELECDYSVISNERGD